MAVDVLLDNPQILLRQVGTGDPTVMRAPGAGDLADLGEGFYLDLPGDALKPGCLYEKDYERFTAGRPSAVYAHIAQQADRPGLLAVQYWLYWYYNDWNNKHESDWEFVQVLFPASSVAEALDAEPLAVGYAQHEGGERADWDDDKLQREGTHPVVYSSQRSHASYFGPAVYMGRGASEGFGCDDTESPVDPGRAGRRRAAGRGGRSRRSAGVGRLRGALGRAARSAEQRTNRAEHQTRSGPSPSRGRTGSATARSSSRRATAGEPR